MSVIWSGVTEGGAIVPVQVTDQGKVVTDSVAPTPLWEKNDESLHPVVITDDVATGGAFRIWGSQKRYAEIVSLPDAGDVTLTLPSQSGTFALSSDIPPPTASWAPHAYCVVSGSGTILKSFNIDKIRYVDAGRQEVYFSTELSSANPLVLLTLSYDTYNTGAQFINYQNIDTEMIRVRFRNYQNQTSTQSAEYSLVVYDVPPDADGLVRYVENIDQLERDAEAAQKESS